MSSVRTTENAEATRRRRTAAAACSQREEGSCQQWSDIRYRLRIEGKGEDRFDFIPFQSLHIPSFLSGTGVCTYVLQMRPRAILERREKETPSEILETLEAPPLNPNYAIIVRPSVHNNERRLDAIIGALGARPSSAPVPVGPAKKRAESEKESREEGRKEGRK